jgi:hypothetical protein
MASPSAKLVRHNNITRLSSKNSHSATNVCLLFTGSGNGVFKTRDTEDGFFDCTYGEKPGAQQTQSGKKHEGCEQFQGSGMWVESFTIAEESELKTEKAGR